MVEEYRPKGKLWLTRADHLRAGSSPPIDPKFGDNVSKGDTLTDQELAERYEGDLNAIRKTIQLPEDLKNIILEPIMGEFPSDLAYYRSRGIDIYEGLTFIGGEANLPDIKFYLYLKYDFGL